MESTRIDPRLVFATPTVAAAPVEVFGGDAAAAAPPPHAAPVRAAIGITATLARKVMGLRRGMSLLRLRSINGRGNERVSNHATRSPQTEDLVVTGVFRRDCRRRGGMTEG